MLFDLRQVFLYGSSAVRMDHRVSQAHNSFPTKTLNQSADFPLDTTPITQTSSFALRLAYMEERSKCSSGLIYEALGPEPESSGQLSLRSSKQVHWTVCKTFHLDVS